MPTYVLDAVDSLEPSMLVKFLPEIFGVFKHPKIPSLSYSPGEIHLRLTDIVLHLPCVNVT